MDATTMPSITSLVAKLQTDYPQLTFKSGDDFRWSPQEMTLYYPSASSDTATLLHEVGHALLGHNTYTKDIQLIEMERDAWEYARKNLSGRYDSSISESIVQESLDTYRDWLHARSTCPNCQATGVQTKTQHYKCVACHTQWRVNEARICALRRYTLH
ncbi:MAG TPA: hypothetical protein VF281_04375 [Candidatus Saccharimonadales bacterium]